MLQYCDVIVASFLTVNCWCHRDVRWRVILTHDDVPFFSLESNKPLQCACWGHYLFQIIILFLESGNLITVCLVCMYFWSDDGRLLCDVLISSWRYYWWFFPSRYWTDVVFSVAQLVIPHIPYPMSLISFGVYYCRQSSCCGIFNNDWCW